MNVKAKLDPSGPYITQKKKKKEQEKGVFFKEELLRDNYTKLTMN
jgi:hypothetical protein